MTEKIKVMNWAKYFARSSGFLLLMTGIAKLISAGGSAPVLKYLDPVFRLSFREIFIIVGIIEVLIALVCILSRQVQLCCKLVAWMASNFLLYRFCLLWVGYVKPCNCLGSLTASIHLSERTADYLMKFILTYLLFGSYSFLFSLRKKAIQPPTTPDFGGVD